MKLEIILRRIIKNKQWFILNVLGLSLAFICSLLVYSFTSKELSYDAFHTKADRIYRLTQNSNTGKSSMIDARIWNGWAPIVKEEFPQIENYVRIATFRNALVNIDENAFYSTKAFCVDSSFFDVFDFELISGNLQTVLKQPDEVIITQSTAKKYFGTLDVLGKKINIKHQRAEVSRQYTIQGILKDIPENSHFKADFLCSMDESIERWAYSYLLLKPDANYIELQNSIQNIFNEKYTDNDYIPIADLQALKNIHLHSHKSRELEQNGNVRNLFLLLSGALILVIIAFINFGNLNFVRYLSEQKNIMVKTTNGATQMNLALEFLKENFVLFALVLGLGLTLQFNQSNLIEFSSQYTIEPSETIGLSLIFLLLMGLIAWLPFLLPSQRINALEPLAGKAVKSKFFLILQLSLSVIAITSTLFLQKQINYINQLHPNATNTDLVVIPNNSQQIVDQYETLKSELLKHPEIKDVCAVMEEPAGIVTDNCLYTLESSNSDEAKVINMLCIDSNFFSFFDIKPLAGTINLGATTTLKWEQKAIELGKLEEENQPLPFGLKDEIESYSEKYIINRMALKTLGFNKPEDAIGKKFQLNFFLKYMFRPGEIVGVVDDFHYTNMYVKEKPLVMVARKMFCHCFLFRIDPNKKSAAITTINKEWDKLYPNSPFTFEFVTDSYQKVYQKEYAQLRILIVFSIISILLSAMGLFAMVSFNLNMKIKEIGVRRVNGARVSEIIKLLFSSYIRWVMLAFILACPVAFFAIKKWLESFAYQTNLSWWVFALAGCTTLFIALCTVSLQTLKAASKNPVEALKYE